MLDGLPVVREAFPRTVRLVSTARLRPPVLEKLVSADEVAALAEIEGATSQRLLAEQRGAEGISRDEFLHGVPYAEFRQRRLRLLEAARAEPLQRDARRLVRGARRRDLHPRSRLSHDRIPGAVGQTEGRGRIRGNVRQHGGRVRRSSPDAGPPVSQSRIRPSAIRSAMRSPTPRGRKGSTGTDLPFGAPPGRNLHCSLRPHRGAIRRAGRGLSTGMVRRPGASDHTDCRLTHPIAAAGIRSRAARRLARAYG